MNKFTPYQKLSRKKQRELDAARRSDWGIIQPTTKRIESAKRYNRKKLRKPDDGLRGFLFCAQGGRAGIVAPPVLN